MSRFSLFYQCHTSFPTQNSSLTVSYSEHSFFFPLTSTIPQSISFSTSSPTPFNTSYISLPFLKDKFGCAFLFFSPNNFLLFAPASHNECCVKVCTSFFPTRWILLSQPCNELFPLLKYQIFPLYFSIIYCFHAQIIPVCQQSSLFQISLNLPYLTFVPQFHNPNTHPFVSRLCQRLLLIYWENI